MKSDYPVSNKKDDLLKRYDTAQQIAKGIFESFKVIEDSVVIGINGEWGSGKSSFMNFIKSEVEKLINSAKDHSVLFEFNPWMFSAQSELQNVFLLELSKSLKRVKSRGAWSKGLEIVAETLPEMGKLLVGVSSYFPDPVISAGSSALKAGTKIAAKSLASPMPLKALKDKTNSALIKNGIRLFVFIDDIDRLSPEEIKEMFQLIKLNADFKKTIFIVAYDRQIVTESLSIFYQGEGAAARYLEKIVQVDYTVPRVLDEYLKEIFFKDIGNLTADFEPRKLVRVEGVWHSTLKYRITSLRNVYRLINSIRLRLSAIADQINIEDFILIEFTRIFEPEVYNLIYAQRGRLLFSSRHSGLTDNDIMETLGLSGNSYLIDLVKRLFKVTHAEADQLLAERRIASPFYFDRYFTFQLTPRDVEEEKYKTFIGGRDVKVCDDILGEMSSRQILNSFYKGLLPRIEKLSDDDKDFFVEVLMRFGHFNFTIDVEDDFYETMECIVEIVLTYSTSLTAYSVFKRICVRDDNQTLFSRLYCLASVNNELTRVLPFDIRERQIFSRLYREEMFDKELLLKDEDRFEGSLRSLIEHFSHSIFWSKTADFAVRDLAIWSKQYGRQDVYSNVLENAKGSEAELLKVLAASLSWIGIGGDRYYTVPKQSRVPDITVSEITELHGKSRKVKRPSAKQLELQRLIILLREDNCDGRIMYQYETLKRKANPE